MHPVLEKARALLANREQDEAEHQRWREQRADQIFAAETDALIARVEATKAKAEIKQRDFNDSVIYKTREDALVRDDVTDHHQQSQPTTYGRQMSADLQQQWNEWCDSRILHHIAEYNNKDLMQHFEEFGDIIAEEVDRIAQSIIKEQARKIILYDPGKALEAEIEKAIKPLRCEIEALHERVTGLKKV